MDSAILYKMKDLQCDMCHSLPVPPVYHCIVGHFLCSKCHDNDTNQCTINNCKQDTPLCKVTTFLLTRMEIICPNDKSRGCSTSLPIEDFNTHVDQCSHSPPRHTCSCPCCGDTCVDIAALLVHFFEIHPPIEVAPEQPEIITLAQGGKILLRLESSQYLLLRFEGDVVCVQHMWWDQARYYQLHVSYFEHDWGYSGEKTFDTLSTTQQYLKLPISPEKIEVVVVIGFLDAKAALLNLDDLAGHEKLEMDAPVKDLTCYLCYKIITVPVNHCMSGHTVCDPCTLSKANYEKKVGKDDEEFLKCAGCRQMVMRCHVGSYILSNLELRCPNRDVGCQCCMSIHEFEDHVDNCSKPFTCPVCHRGGDDPNYLRNHIGDHRPRIIKPKEQNRLMVTRGRSFIRDGLTNDDFLLIFEDNGLCLQHMSWAEPQEYFIEFSDLGGTWSFHGKTVAVEKFPKLNSGCLKIPSTILNPKSTLPIPITLEIRHEDYMHEDYMHDDDEIADLEKAIKRRRIG